MSRVVIIGAAGHIGTYLVPSLVDGGHGYAPRYGSLDAIHEALAWLAANGQDDVGGQPFPAPSAQ